MNLYVPSLSLSLSLPLVSNSRLRYTDSSRLFVFSQGEIRATGFNETVDKLDPILEEGKVYRISKARVNIAKKQFTNLNNEYEIMFDKNTEVEPVRSLISDVSL